MAVQHQPTGIIHSGSKGGTTGCGENTRKNPSHWENTNERVSCEKDGCP